MATESASDQALLLKKRARRRLVGAIVLLLLMVIFLPMLLKEPAPLKEGVDVASENAINITMPDNATQEVEGLIAPSEGTSQSAALPETQQVPQSVAAQSATTQQAPLAQTPLVEVKPKAERQLSKEPIDDSQTKSLAKTEPVKAETAKAELLPTKPAAKASEVKLEAQSSPQPKAENKPSDVQSVEKKSADEKSDKEPKKPAGNGAFTIQIGVFSEIGNVKQLALKLQNIGFTSRTETITTPAGKKFRLKVGNFASRQKAAYELIKIKDAGLPGMVVSR